MLSFVLFHEKRLRIAAFGFGFCEMTVDNVLLANTIFHQRMVHIIPDVRHHRQFPITSHRKQRKKQFRTNKEKITLFY